MPVGRGRVRVRRRGGSHGSAAVGGGKRVSVGQEGPGLHAGRGLQHNREPVSRRHEFLLRYGFWTGRVEGRDKVTAAWNDTRHNSGMVKVSF